MTRKGKTSLDDYGEADIQECAENCRRQGEGSVDGPLAGFIYHDLRHPLTAIQAYAELLAEEGLDGLKREDFCQEIRRAVCRMNDLISLLLEFSKGLMTPHSEIADIVETVRRAIQVVAIRPEFRRLGIRYEHEGLTQGCFDPRRLQQVIINVVLNACEAVAPRSGRVEVRSLGSQDHLEISIRDNGPGIPDSVRHAVFQPFVSYGKTGGTGLGLAIVQKIIRDEGGEIFLETAPEQGTQFRVVLPFTRPRRAEPSIRVSVRAPLSVNSRPESPIIKH